MSEFVNRMATQRKLLRIVNRRKWKNEELFGLTQSSIDRWVSANQIPPRSRVVDLVERASSKLFFLAHKSQDQVTEDYQAISREVATLASEIEREIAA